MALPSVRVEYVGRAPLEGSDDRQLLATLRTGEPAPSPSTVRVASARSFVPEISSSAGRDPGRGSNAGRAALQPRQYLGRLRVGQRDLGNVGLQPVRAVAHAKIPRAVSYENDAHYAASSRGLPARRSIRSGAKRSPRAAARKKRVTELFRKAIRAALTSSGRSCWIQ